MTGETGDKKGKHISAPRPVGLRVGDRHRLCHDGPSRAVVLGRELTDDEHEQLFADNVLLARITQVPSAAKSRAEFDAYYDRMVDEVLTLHPSLAESLPTLTDPAVALDELDLWPTALVVPPGCFWPA